MKKNLMAVLAVVGLLSVGAVSASAATGCDNCADRGALQQFRQETSAAASALQAKELELSGLSLADSIDIHRKNALETEIRQLNEAISNTAAKYNISGCNRG